MQKSLQRIGKIYHNNKNFISNTTLEYNQRLSDKYHCNIFLKREDLHKVRSFKIRGAYNKIIKLNNSDKIRGVVCASAGNHAQGVAYSCNALNIRADIFVPENTPLQKIQSINKFKNDKINVHITGANFDMSLKESLHFSKKNNTIFIHPFADQDIIDGQGTIAVEIYNEIKPDIILGSIGGGGLMSGISLYSKEANPDCLLYGVESNDCNAMSQSIKHQKIIKLNKYNNFVDGTAVKQVSNLTLNICNKNLNKILLVPNGKLCNTMLELYQNDGIITEPAGALSVSALDYLDISKINGKNIVAIVSGGNNDISRYPEIEDIALRYKKLKHYFIIKFAQRPGELKKFVNILGKNDNITRFEYIKKTNKSYGQVLIGIELQQSSDLHFLIKNIEYNNFDYRYINNDDILMSYLI